MRGVRFQLPGDGEWQRDRGEWAQDLAGRLWRSRGRAVGRDGEGAGERMGSVCAEGAVRRVPWVFPYSSGKKDTVIVFYDKCDLFKLYINYNCFYLIYIKFTIITNL